MEILIFQLIILLFSVVIHEVSHGFVAEYLGDSTARLAGRLTLNPLKHLDPFGSFVLPFLLFFASGGSFIFGWAKPVPYNPFNLKNPERAAGLIAMAGPFSNLIIAIIFGVFFHLVKFLPISDLWLSSLVQLLTLIVLINIMLAVFNLVPLPPLDGSKVLFAVLPSSFHQLRSFLEQYGSILLIVFIIFGFRMIYPIVDFIYNVLI